MGIQLRKLRNENPLSSKSPLLAPEYTRMTQRATVKSKEDINNVLIVFKFLSDQIQRFNHKSL